MFLEFLYLSISSQFIVQGDLELSGYLINDNFPLSINRSHPEARGALTPIEKLSISSEAVLVCHCPSPWTLKCFMLPLHIDFNLNPFVKMGPNRTKEFYQECMRSLAICYAFSVSEPIKYSLERFCSLLTKSFLTKVHLNILYVMPSPSHGALIWLKAMRI